MAKRLTRARQKIQQAHIPYRVPPDHELPDRWAAVLATTYLLFNEGYAATSGPLLVRDELVDEAVRLARLLVRLQPDDAGALGLLALMLLQDSRRAARVGRRRRAGAARRPGPLAGGTGADPGRCAAGRRGSASHPHHPGPVRRAGRDRGLPRPGADVRRHRLGRRPVLVRRAAHPRRRPGRPAQPGGRGRRARRRRGRPGLVDAIDGLDGYPLWHATRAVLLRRLGREAEAVEAEARA